MPVRRAITITTASPSINKHIVEECGGEDCEYWDSVDPLQTTDLQEIKAYCLLFAEPLYKMNGKLLRCSLCLESGGVEVKETLRFPSKQCSNLT